MSTQKTDSGLVKVTIYQPHTHAGKHYIPDAKGIELEVSVQDAAFLKALGKTDKSAAASASITPAAAQS